MRTTLPVLVVSAVVLAACGGGDDSSSANASSDSWCALAQRIEDNSDDLDGSFESGSAAIRSAYDEFRGLLADAEGVAPDEIREAVATASSGVEQFAAALDDVDYDISQLTEEAFDALGEEMDQATEQIEAYNLRECGITPSSDSDESAPDEPVAADEPEQEPAIEEPSADEAADVDAAIDDQSTFVGDPDSGWCVVSRELDAKGNVLDDLDYSDPVAVEAAFTEMIGLYQSALPFTPPELQGDVDVSYAEVLELEAALRAVGYDFLNADLSTLDDVDNSVQGANDNIERYNEQVCGIAADDDGSDDQTDGDDSSDFDPAAGTIRDQTIAALVAQGFTEQEASCIFDNFDFSDPDAAADDDSLIAMFDTCGIDLVRLAELGG